MDDRVRERFLILNKWMYLRNHGIKLAEHKMLRNRSLAVYGLGDLGKRLIEELEIMDAHPAYAVDKKAEDFFADFPVYDGGKRLPHADVMIMTLTRGVEDVGERMKTVFDGEIISLGDIVEDLWKSAWERT